jgi:hypothetical protein
MNYAGQHPLHQTRLHILFGQAPPGEFRLSDVARVDLAGALAHHAQFTGLNSEFYRFG